MGIEQQEVHEKIIDASFTQKEIENILIEHVLRESGIKKQTLFQSARLHLSTLNGEFSATCKIKIDLSVTVTGS